MSGENVVAGPEVEMVELEPISSSLSSFSVDLDLNLGPSFALDLALGRGEREEEQEEARRQSVDGPTTIITTPPPVSRPHWSRFEPGMLAGTRVEEEEEEETIMREDQNSPSPSSLVTNEAHYHQPGGTVSHDDDNDGLPSVSQYRFGRGFASAVPDHPNHSSDGGEGSSQSPLLALRNPRHMRLARRPRQALFTPPRNVDQGSTVENGVVLSPADTSSTQDMFSRDGDSRIQNTSLEIMPSNEYSDPKGNNNNDEVPGSNSGGAGGAHFECNICLEMAVEPVVTCCGHLFCWPCLHRWLHLRSSRKECPVCKGFLADDVITPIYGRGTSEAGDRSSGNNNTPPRPHAHRISEKRRWQGRSTQERSETQSGSTEHEVSPNANAGASAELLILNRLRIAQRLQREHLDERLRLRLRQRMMGRRGSGAFRSFLGLVTPISSLDSGGQVQQQAADSMDRQVQNQAAENVDEQAHMRSLENTDESQVRGVQLRNQALENVDGQVHTQPIVNTEESLARNTMERIPGVLLPPRPFEERTGARSYLSPLNAGESGLSASEQSVLEIGTPELGSIAFRSWQGNVSYESPQQRSWRNHPSSSSGSSSANVEPGPSHARKRRRLN